jgi:hypothetical protein
MREQTKSGRNAFRGGLLDHPLGHRRGEEWGGGAVFPLVIFYGECGRL